MVVRSRLGPTRLCLPNNLPASTPTHAHSQLPIDRCVYVWGAKAMQQVRCHTAAGREGNDVSSVNTCMHPYMHTYRSIITFAPPVRDRVAGDTSSPCAPYRERAVPLYRYAYRQPYTPTDGTQHRWMNDDRNACRTTGVFGGVGASLYAWRSVRVYTGGGDTTATRTTPLTCFRGHGHTANCRS
eukprot:GHVU01157911.1.p1 GENE.GHVU01157911.1~~GHVU01157911.1.p1  ORF type:complete len:184 (+),score=5.60 GHVU01157911.1:104-655(+)